MESREPKPDWRLRLGAFVLFCVTAFLPGLLFFGFVFGMTLLGVNRALDATLGVQIPWPSSRRDTTEYHGIVHGNGGSLYCSRCDEYRALESSAKEEER